jgi:hypothetical protein
MRFRASAEVFKAAFPALDKARRTVDPFLNAAFTASSLASLDCLLRYTPIVMPEGMRERYPERSKLDKKRRVYDCSPQLNYEVFVNGSLREQLDEYLRGVALSAPYLIDLGASLEQMEEFRQILSNAVDRILVERPDQTRH